MDPAIQTDDLTKYYDGLLAVDHVNFKVEKGEIFGFLGPNGAGKTTTIRMLVGLTQPSNGTATVNGYDIRNEMLEIKKQVGVVPEASNLYNELSVWDNLQFIAGLYHVPKGERKTRIKELLREFNLQKRENMKFGKLSKGLKRRVIVVAALIHNPSIVFLDEPTTGLDVFSARALRELLASLKETGVTVFLTTHYIEEADHLCDRIAIIVEGKIVTIDTPENMKSFVQDTPILEVSFKSPVTEHDMMQLDEIIDAQIEGNSVKVITEDISKTMDVLTQFAIKEDLKIENVNTVRPSLEEAFVQLTGIESDIMRLEKERRGS